MTKFKMVRDEINGGVTVKEVTQQLLEALEECLPEIQRLNKAAGHTVFNPAATDLVKAAIAKARNQS